MAEHVRHLVLYIIKKRSIDWMLCIFVVISQVSGKNANLSHVVFLKDMK